MMSIERITRTGPRVVARPVGASLIAALGVVLAAALMLPAERAASAGLMNRATNPKPATAINLPIVPALRDIVVGRVETLGSQQFASTYGGVAFEDDESKIVVYLTELDPVVEAAFTDVSAGLDLSFRFTHGTESSTNALHSRVSNDRHYLAGLGISLNVWGPDAKTGQEDIGVENLTQSQTSTLQDRYGTDNVHVYNVSQDLAEARVAQLSRVNDISRWNPSDVFWATAIRRAVPRRAAPCSACILARVDCAY